LTRHQRGFKQLTRPVFPSPVAAPVERAATSAFPRASHPADQEPDDARRGGDRPSSTDLELLAQHHIRVDPPIGSSLTTCDLASHIDLQQSAAVHAGFCNVAHRAISIRPPLHAESGSRADVAPSGVEGWCARSPEPVAIASGPAGENDGDRSCPGPALPWRPPYAPTRLLLRWTSSRTRLRLACWSECALRRATAPADAAGGRRPVRSFTTAMARCSGEPVAWVSSPGCRPES